ncbi:hydantoinase/oxoprolinase family protein [Enhydrobacter sp.]|uniref:hydantoinase/oxoprolinase family protein n=1 Tax=Enhydrobacter sp. TaxID=1894999 RepID=UPI002638BC13|nr:hydantoinase/oxoprolinase family protein [Enhydrobacter sp.]WIM10277.1 MAG: Hydantoinase/oxoprolinase family protein [Enhydrobacter sp.]
MKKAYRIGIDVGGTFTKAVLIDNATLAIVGRCAVPTTHGDKRGVAKGVVDVFHAVLDRSGVDPKDVVFIAHSTTQATNALLEGDVAPVGVIGMAGGPAAELAREQSRIGAIELAPGHVLKPGHRFIAAEKLDERTARAAVTALRGEGAGVVVATSAFAVDDNAGEELVRRAAAAQGLPVTCGHEMSKLYGLAARTRTAVVNASILPRMLDTAAMTEASVREAGIEAPLMIMRGDGGVMDIREMRRRPAMTMLSGPAASVAGALMHLRISDGIYFEVGGTSTNIGVIRNGRPTVRYARIGGHETHLSSLDVRVVGMGGGSMVRARDGKLGEIGPRSAHIAGLRYAAFADADRFAGAAVAHIRPKGDDPADYVAIRSASGDLHALTVTCAANILGYAKPGMHAYGDPQAARAAMAPLADMLGTSIEDTARHILRRAADKAAPIVEQLVAEYDLDRDQAVLVGEGGGAGALVPFLAERMGLPYLISRDAEVISSIGVALALVREMVERLIPDPGPDDLRAIRREAFDAVVRMGAAPQTVEVTIEIDPHTRHVRATAVGAVEMDSAARSAVTEDQARAIAAASLGMPPEATCVTASTDRMRVIQAALADRHPVRVVDLEGAVRLQRSDARVQTSTVELVVDAMERLWKAAERPPEIVLLTGSHLIDLAGCASFDQACAIVRTELEGSALDATVVLVAMGALRR